MDYNTNRHACYNLKYHLVVVTKYRHPCINHEVLERLREITQYIFDKWNCNLIEFSGENDHIHILFEAPPQVQLSKLVNNYKTVSSRLIRKEFNNFLSKFYWKPCFWSQSYLILTTGGAPLEVIKQYIAHQQAQPKS